MACQRCGHCCVSLNIVDNSLTLEGAKGTGFKEFLEAHHCTIGISKKPGMEGKLQIRVPLLCKYLSMQNGVATCLIYENRPPICRAYKCERAKEDE